MSTPSVQLSSRTWPIRSVQVQLGSGPLSMREPKFRVASGSQEDPGYRRAEQETPREKPLTTEALAARGDSLQHLRRRVAVSISRSACAASSSTAVGGSEEQDKLRRRMDEYLLHEEYYKSIRAEDRLQSCQQPSEPVKCVQLMWRIPISEGQPMVPWTKVRHRFYYLIG